MNQTMSPQEFENYLGLLSRLLRLRTDQRTAIEEELRTHMQERFAAFRSKGIEAEEAVSLALAEFGDAAALAAEFSAVARLQRRRWMMRISMGMAVAALLLVAVVVSIWPNSPGELTSRTAQAQDVEKPTPVKVDEHEPNSQTQAKLEVLTAAEFIEEPLCDCLANLAKAAGVQIFIDVRALDDVGVPIDTPITFRLKDLPVETLLRLMLRDLELSYMLDHGLVIVSTPEEIENNLEIRVYRVDDLVNDSRIADRADSAAPAKMPGGRPGAEGMMMPGNMGARGMGMGMGMDMAGGPRMGMDMAGGPGMGAAFGNMRALRDGSGKKQPTGRGGGRISRNASSTPTSDMQKLIDLIVQIVEPDTWDDVGGVGEVDEYRGALVIAQTYRVHQKIEKLLNDLREVINARGQEAAK